MQFGIWAFGAWGALGFRAWGLGFRVWGLGNYRTVWVEAPGS